MLLLQNVLLERTTSPRLEDLRVAIELCTQISGDYVSFLIITISLLNLLLRQIFVKFDLS